MTDQNPPTPSERDISESAAELLDDVNNQVRDPSWSERLNRGVNESFIVWLFGFFWRFLRCASPCKGIKRAIRLKRPEDPLYGIVDLYILAAFGASVVCAIVGCCWPEVLRGNWRFLILLAVCFRLAEILGVTMDLLVFDRGRPTRDGKPRHVASYDRSLILSLINYFEVMLLYGLVYFSTLHDSFMPKLTSMADAIYFSAITFTTLGYGDILPCGNTRLVAASEAVAGVLLSILLLSRVVALVPRTPALDHEASE